MILISPSAASHLRTMLAERQSERQSERKSGAAAEGSGAEAPTGSGAEAPAGSGAEAPAGGDSGRRGLRIVVEKGGCAGMQYEMRFDVSRPEDIVSESEGGCVFVDPESARFLGGALLDYCDDLVGTGFRLQNPSAARSCGCGTSFEPLEGAESLPHSGAEQQREATAVVR